MQAGGWVKTGPSESGIVRGKVPQKQKPHGQLWLHDGLVTGLQTIGAGITANRRILAGWTLVESKERFPLVHAPTTAAI